MADCLFCKIVSGEIPCRAVYEDDDVLAFLDIAPLARGHTLILPKRHAKRLGDLSVLETSSLFGHVTRIERGVLAATGRRDALIAVHDGPEAGQEVPHVHVHVVPRSNSDGGGPVHALFAARPKAADDELAEMMDAIKARL